MNIPKQYRVIDTANRSMIAEFISSASSDDIKKITEETKYDGKKLLDKLLEKGYTVLNPIEIEVIGVK
jgi:hypothetical protein